MASWRTANVLPAPGGPKTAMGSGTPPRAPRSSWCTYSSRMLRTLRRLSISVRSTDDQAPTVSTGMPKGSDVDPCTAAVAATCPMDVSAYVWARVRVARGGRLGRRCWANSSPPPRSGRGHGRRAGTGCAAGRGLRRPGSRPRARRGRAARPRLTASTRSASRPVVSSRVTAASGQPSVAGAHAPGVASAPIPLLHAGVEHEHVASVPLHDHGAAAPTMTMTRRACASGWARTAAMISSVSRSHESGYPT